MAGTPPAVTFVASNEPFGARRWSSMNARHGDIAIPVVGPPVIAPPRPKMPAHTWLFAAFMGVAAALAAVVGVVLGILAATEAGIGATRWSEVVQAHGRIQLFGFAAPFAVALALEFIPRLNQQPMFPARVRFGLPTALLAGAISMAGAQLWEPAYPVLGTLGVVAFAAAAAWFAYVGLRFKAPRPAAVDPQPLFFRAAALWLAATALVIAWAFASAEANILPLDLSRAIAETFLRGFIMLLIVAVGLRAFPGHLVLPPMSPSHQRLAFAGFNGALALWLASSGLGSLDEIRAGVRLADLLFAVTIVGFTHSLGILPAIKRKSCEPRYAALIPLAWLGVIVYAVLLALEAILAPDHSLYRDGALRHVFMLGFMAPLMLAMAHIVLARFGTGRVPWENLLTFAFIAVFAAWPLRTIPVLFSDAPSSLDQALLGIAGVLTALGFAATAAVCLRTAFEVRRLHRSPESALLTNRVRG